MIVTNIALIFVFILIGGVFAAAEMALVSLRDSQVKQLSTKGKRGQAVAELASDPNNFLSAVQIGVTLFGFLSASLGGATLAGDLVPVLTNWGLAAEVAYPLSLALITIVISYFSIVLGELTSKRLAMQRAESFALSLAPMINAIAKLARPIIWFLGASTDLVVRVLGGDPKTTKEEVSDDELRAMVSSSATLGAEERQIVDEVFSAGEIILREAMVPRTEVDFLGGDTPAYKAIRLMQELAHSRFPVIGQDVDEVLGFIHVRDLIDMDPETRQTPVAQLARPILSLPQSMRILPALSAMRAGTTHIALVKDEYGGTAGIVTMEDLVEELIGDITDEYDEILDDSSPNLAAELDGLLTLEEFAEEFGYLLPEGPYDTLAGFVMAELGHLPAVGDAITTTLVGVDPQNTQTVELLVVELDGRRASRIVWRRIATEAEDS